METSEATVRELETALALERKARVAAELSLAALNARFDGLVNASGQTVWMSNPEGELFVVTNWTELTGGEAQGFQGWAWLESLHPDDREPTCVLWAHCLATLEFYEIEHRVVTPDGSYRVLLSRAGPVLDATGKVVEWIGLSRDVTEKRAHQALLRAEQINFRQLADTMPQIVWTADRAGVVNYCNRRWTEYSGLVEGEEHLSHTLTHPDDVVQSQELWSESLADGRPYQYHLRIKGIADGQYRWHLVRALPIRDQDGEITKWFGTTTDIQEQRQLQELLEDTNGELVAKSEELIVINTELLSQTETLLRNRLEIEQAYDEVRRVNGVKDEFIAIISHELRTPLSVISNVLSILNKGRAGTLSEPQENFVAMAVDQTQRLGRLVDDLLDTQKMEAGAMGFTLEEGDLRPFLRGVTEGFAPVISAKSLQFQLKLGDEPLNVRFDRERMSQVAYNLLSNASKFTPLGGVLEVSAQRIGTVVRLSFRDTGAGIAPADLERVFEKFTQAAHPEMRQTGGTGLGLTICKRIIEDGHGGKIWIESVVGQGSEVLIELPAIPSPAS
jgi:PAS domain S-box-containing protein